MNPYEVLNINPDANDKDIKKAYRKLAAIHHPDRGGDPEYFKFIKRAYDILSDPEQRSHFDFHGEVKDKEIDLTPVAMGKIVMHVQGWLQNNNIQKNMIDFIKEKLHQEDSTLANSVNDAELTKGRLNQIKKKVKTKNKENFIIGFIDNKIKEVDLFLTNAVTEAKTINRGLELLEDYSWQEDVQQFIGYSSVSATGVSGW